VKSLITLLVLYGSVRLEQRAVKAGETTPGGLLVERDSTVVIGTVPGPTNADGDYEERVFECVFDYQLLADAADPAELVVNALSAAMQSLIDKPNRPKLSGSV
jgi:hypothetical protein